MCCVLCVLVIYSIRGVQLIYFTISMDVFLRHFAAIILFYFSVPYFLISLFSFSVFIKSPFSGPSS